MAYTYNDDCDSISKDEMYRYVSIGLLCNEHYRIYESSYNHNTIDECNDVYNKVYNTRGVSQEYDSFYRKYDTNINAESLRKILRAEDVGIISEWIYNNKVPVTDFIYKFAESDNIKYIYDAIVLGIEYLHEIPSKLEKYIPDMDTHHISAAIASWISGCDEELPDCLCEQLHKLSNANIFDICNDVHDNELIQYSDVFVNEIKSRTDVKFINAMISLYLDCTKRITRKPTWLNDKYYKDAVLTYDHDTLNKQWRFIIRLYVMSDYNVYIFPKWLLELIPKNRLDTVYEDLLLNRFNHGNSLNKELEDEFIRTFNDIDSNVQTYTKEYADAEYVMYVNMHKRLYKFEDIFYKNNGAISMMKDYNKYNAKYMQHVGYMEHTDLEYRTNPEEPNEDYREEAEDISKCIDLSFYRYNDMNIVIPQQFVCEEVYNKYVDDKHNLVNLCTYIRVNNGIDSINDVPEHIVKRLTQEHIDIINNALSVNNGIHTLEDINNIIDKLSLALPECHKGVEDYINTDEEYIEEHKDEFIDKDANKYIHRNDIFDDYGKIQYSATWRVRHNDCSMWRLNRINNIHNKNIIMIKECINSLLHDYTIRNRDAKYDRDVVDKNTNNSLFVNTCYYDRVIFDLE